MRIAGASTTVAPSPRSVAAIPLACARARVTATRLPPSGRASASQPSSSCSAATPPTTVIAGALIPASATRDAMSLSVPRTERWSP